MLTPANSNRRGIHNELVLRLPRSTRYTCARFTYIVKLYPFRSHMCLPQVLAPVRLEDLMPIGAIDELHL